MSDPRVGEHMPLLTFEWDEAVAAKFVANKEARWDQDGLGHWVYWTMGNMSVGAVFKEKGMNGILGWF